MCSCHNIKCVLVTHPTPPSSVLRAAYVLCVLYIECVLVTYIECVFVTYIECVLVISNTSVLGAAYV